MLPEMAKDIGRTVNVRVLSRSFNRYPVAIRAAEAGKRAPDGIKVMGVRRLSEALDEAW